MTLWPISMFSTIFAKPRPTAPAHHADRLLLPANMIPLAASRARCAAMVRRM
jgi:hypothetical protein